jgi:hypothetical protein
LEWIGEEKRGRGHENGERRERNSLPKNLERERIRKNEIFWVKTK